MSYSKVEAALQSQILDVLSILLTLHGTLAKLSDGSPNKQDVLQSLKSTLSEIEKVVEAARITVKENGGS